ncbi:hypothetical protein [Superficieibacter sp.]|uniref:hypothetical protein n=1 Tax=Superficieibacter sp. TaxID=2303322 RepID=UPI0028AB3B4A|nr:hypothetical protein [Superficieibacter sp.]
MTELSKERLAQYAYDKRMCNVNDEIREMARRLLAAEEQRPVMYCKGREDDLDPETVSTERAVVEAWVEEWNNEQSQGEPIYKTVSLYRHPQQGKAVQVPDEIDRIKAFDLLNTLPDGDVVGCVKYTWNACRATMLTSEPVSNRDELPDFRENENSSTKHFRENAETSTKLHEKCWCHTCRPMDITDMRFVVCPDCGNKRCPKANDHRNACSGSNEPGQKGSAYPAAPAWVGVDWAEGCKPSNSPAIPEGWKLVPVEPTEAMLDAAYSYPASTTDRMRKQYSAMLAAAPQPEVPGE